MNIKNMTKPAKILHGHLLKVKTISKIKVELQKCKKSDLRPILQNVNSLFSPEILEFL